VNGVDYIAGTSGATSMLMGTISWKNNIIVPLSYYPGSGTVDNAAVGGRFLIGNRVPTFNFTAFLESDSNQYANLISQTTGTAVVTFTFDATHFITFTFHSVSYESVVRTQEEGIVAVTVNVAPKTADDTAAGVLTVTGKCGVADIAQ